MKSGMGGGIYAPNEMVDHMSLLKDRYGLLAGLDPGMVGSGPFESLFTRLRTKEMVAEKEGGLGNVYGVPGT